MVRSAYIVLALLLSIAPYNASWGQDAITMGGASPKLRHFLVQYPKASRTLTNVLCEALLGRTFCLYYFYSDDETTARAFHDYPDEVHVAIYIRENQHPLDEFICLIFEAQNSINEKQFTKLIDQARSGSISKIDFTRDFGRLEFDATKKTRDLIKDLKFGNGDKSTSSYYKLFKSVPDDFDEFLLYTRKISSHRDIVKELETKYDLLRKQPTH